MGLTKRILEKEQIENKGSLRNEIDVLKGEILKLNEKVRKLSQNPCDKTFLN